MKEDLPPDLRCKLDLLGMRTYYSLVFKSWFVFDEKYNVIGSINDRYDSELELVQKILAELPKV